MSDQPPASAAVTNGANEASTESQSHGGSRRKLTDAAASSGSGGGGSSRHMKKSASHHNSLSHASSSGSVGSVGSSSALSQWAHVGNHRTTIPPEATFDPNSDQIKQDLLGMIVQYLQHEGFTMASATIQDEANVKIVAKGQDKDALRRMTKAILEGDWDLVAKLITKNLRKFHSQQGFLYAVCKQEYFELIDRQEYQKAFTFLTTHLKPLEKISTMTNRNEFKELCYLLTCKSVAEGEAFRQWEGVAKSREKLVEQLRSTFELEDLMTTEETQAMEISDNRLVHLLHQSVAYQMEFSRYHPKTIPKVSTLLRDFECEVLPNAVKSTYVGHSQNVKYVTFVGQDGEVLASGSSDATIKLWPVEFASTKPSTEGMGQICETWSRDLRGHSSRIWYLSSNASGDRLFSGSGDGTVKIWDLRTAMDDMYASLAETNEDEDRSRRSIRASSVDATTNLLTSTECIATLHSQSDGDIYSVNIHPNETHLVTGGYDQTVRLFDIQTGVATKTFRGHVASVTDAQFNRHANLIVSGSKDGTIRLWDILSGLCVHTLRQTLGEVTSVCMASNGFTLLSGSRNNSNRLWDLRMLNAPRVQLATHATGGSGSGGNSSSSAMQMGSSSSSSRSGSLMEQRPIQRFKGHQNTAKNVVRASFGPRESFVLGGSEDGAVYVWDVATGKLLEKLAGHQGVTYNAKWHEKQALMASSSHDGTVKTWWYEEPSRR